MRNGRCFLVTALAFFAITSGAHASLIYGVNLIENPSAELGGPGPSLNNTVANVPDWTLTQGSFTEVRYSSMPGGVPQLTDPGPPNRGVNLFSGGPNPDPNAPDYISQGDQILDVADQAATIDAGSVSFGLSGWLGGYFDQRDNAQVSALFEDSLGNVISTALIGPVRLGDRRDQDGTPQTELLFRSTMGDIPAGTRSIDFQVLMNGIDGNQNDGYADDLSFVATSNAVTDPGSTVPEPGSLVLLGIGLTALSLLRRRKPRG